MPPPPPPIKSNFASAEFSKALQAVERLRAGKRNGEIREVSRVIWPEGGGNIGASDSRKLVYESLYMGDRLEEWILVIENDVETQRHNVRFVETIIWAE